MSVKLWFAPAIAAITLSMSGCVASQPKESFSKLAEEFIYTSLANSPSTATQVGYHRHGSIELDSLLDDYSPAALEKQRRWYQDLRLRLHRSLNDATMTADDRADLDIIEDQISLALLELQSIQDYRHDPTMYVELVGNALYAPFVLEYTNKDKRYEHIINRLKGVPRFLGTSSPEPEFSPGDMDSCGHRRERRQHRSHR